MQISIDDFCRINCLRYSEVHKALIYLAAVLKNHIVKRDRIFIDSYGQKMILSNIIKRRNKQ